MKKLIFGILVSLLLLLSMVNAYSEITEDFSDCSEWYDVTGSCGACSEGDYFSSCDDSTYSAGTNSYYIDYDEFPISYSYDFSNGDDAGDVGLWIVETNGTKDFEYFFMEVQANQDRIFFLEGTGEAGLTCDYTPDFVIGQTYGLEFIMLSNWTMDAYVNDAYLCSYSFNNASANRIVQTNYVVLTSESQNDTLDNLLITFGTCTEDWQPYYTSCTIGDNHTLYYTDANSCGTYDNLPGDNGTVSSCNYCTPSWTETSPECVTGESSVETTYDYTNTCCEDTGLASDCTIPANSTTSCIGVHSSLDIGRVFIDFGVEIGIALIAMVSLLVIGGIGTFAYKTLKRK